MTPEPERVVVDVGRIDLHAALEVLDPECLGEDDRQREGLLARRAAGGPDAQLLVVARDEQSRHDDLAQVVPRELVAEEGSDVDEDRVEELDELVRVLLEQRAVLVVAGSAARLEPLVDPPREARLLVAGEVEAACIPDVRQQRVEVTRPLGQWLGHSACSSSSASATGSSVRRTPRTVTASPTIAFALRSRRTAVRRLPRCLARIDNRRSIAAFSSSARSAAHRARSTCSCCWMTSDEGVDSGPGRLRKR